MKSLSLFKLPAVVCLVLGMVVACGTDSPQPAGLVGPDEGGTVGTSGNDNTPGAGSSGAGSSGASSSGGSSSGGTSSGLGGTSSGGNSSSSSSGGSSSGGSSCPSSCRVDSDCAGCGTPTNGGKNCCVMGICAPMMTCPTIRDSGNDGS